MNYLNQIKRLFLSCAGMVFGTTIIAQVSLNEIKIESPIINDHLEIELVFSIEEDYHIQSIHPEDEFLIPTIFTLVNCEEIKIEAIDFLSLENDVRDAYRKEFAVLLRGKLRGDKVTIEGAMEYQACDASKCFFPRTMEVSFGVPVYLLQADPKAFSGVY